MLNTNTKDAASRPVELTEEDAATLATMLNGLLREARDLAGTPNGALAALGLTYFFFPSSASQAMTAPTQGA